MILALLSATMVMASSEEKRMSVAEWNRLRPLLRAQGFSLLPSVENEEQMTQDMERYRRALQQRMSKAAVPNTQRLGMGGGPTKKREQSQKVELRSKIKP
jgi:hypothetical protein